MKRVFEHEIGECQVVIADIGGSYRGIVRKNGKEVFCLEGNELEPLKAALLNHAGKLHPDYFGMDGAKARFLRFFPGGFEDPSYLRRERSYKVDARVALEQAAPLEMALEADPELAVACRKGMRTDLLSQFESARLHHVVKLLIL